MSASLQVRRQGRLLRLTLNRPEKRNALNAATCAALVQALEQANEASETGAVLLDAAGDVFCAGMDLDEASSPDAAELTDVHGRLFTFASWMRQPVVAAVQGPALGGGVGIVANAHIALAAQGATFGLTEIRLGMWPFVIFRSVSAAVGERRAVELSLSGRIFGSPEAVQYGLVHHATPAFELQDRAAAIALALAESSADAVARGLDFAARSRPLSWEQAAALALSTRREAFASGDFREGVRAFKEKRRPAWPSLH
jgi:enoyl-CoA hydratase/carnithine racemase